MHRLQLKTRIISIVKTRYLATLTLGGLTTLILIGCLGQANSTESSVASAALSNQPVPSSKASTAAEDPSSQLSEAQKAFLKGLGISIVVPLYVPQGFKIFQITTTTKRFSTTETKRSSFVSTYDIVYINAQATCLLVSGADARIGGFGGADREWGFRTRTPLLGEVEIEFGTVPGAAKTPSPEQLKTPQSDLGIWPVERVPGLDISLGIATSDDYLHSTYSGCSEKNTSITPLELEKVVKSIVLLK